MFMIITIINDSEFDHYFTLLFELVIITEYLFSNIGYKKLTFLLCVLYIEI